MFKKQINITNHIQIMDSEHYFPKIDPARPAKLYRLHETSMDTVLSMDGLLKANCNLRFYTKEQMHKSYA